MTVLLDISGVFVVMKSWYVCTFFVRIVFLVIVLPLSHAGTLILVFYVNGHFRILLNLLVVIFCLFGNFY